MDYPSKEGHQIRVVEGYKIRVSVRTGEFCKAPFDTVELEMIVLVSNKAVSIYYHNSIFLLIYHWNKRDERDFHFRDGIDILFTILSAKCN